MTARSWGLSVRYVDEGDHLRGTAGALRLAYDEGALEQDFLVLYGDSWLQIDPARVLRAARERREPALMTVFRNDGRWDGSNVVLEGMRIARYAKGLATPPPQMRWIDYGLLAFRREVIGERVPAGGRRTSPRCAANSPTMACWRGSRSASDSMRSAPSPDATSSKLC